MEINVVTSQDHVKEDGVLKEALGEVMNTKPNIWKPLDKPYKNPKVPN